MYKVYSSYKLEFFNKNRARGNKGKGWTPKGAWHAEGGGGNRWGGK